MGAGVTIPVEAIVTLRRRLSALPARHPERGPLLVQTADTLLDVLEALPPRHGHHGDPS